jgi:hypothetical protein
VNREHDQNIASYLLSPVNCARYYVPPWASSGHVAHYLAYLEAPEFAAHYVGVVDEDILTPVVRGDEAVALLLAELALFLLIPLRLHAQESLSSL